MVDAGANQSFANPEGVTPLQYAVLYGSEAMVQALLPHGALERTVLENNMRAEFDLVTLAVQHYIRSDYCLVVCPRDLFRQRAANVDLILSGTRGHWAPADLEGWLECAEEPFVREVLEVVHSHLRFTDLRRAWILVVACSGWRRW
jgi:ankyrin repeat protein